MKQLILAAALTVLSLGANAAVLKQSVAGDTAAPAAPGWIPMTTICYIGDDAASARAACLDDAEIVNLISTSNVVMNSTCVRADQYCPVKSQFMLVTNVFARHH